MTSLVKDLSDGVRLIQLMVGDIIPKLTSPAVKVHVRASCRRSWVCASGSQNPYLMPARRRHLSRTI